MWFLYAVLASVVWGLSYVLNGELFKSLSVLTVVAIQTFVTSVIFAVAAILTGVFRNDVYSVMTSSRLMWLMLFGILALAIAEYGIGYSIQGKNATLAGLIEISYPIFIALFAYFLFGENQLSFATAVGGVLIFAGVSVIYVAAR
jgi:drug/metabolite transporter (DMT)-like permease